MNTYRFSTLIPLFFLVGFVALLCYACANKGYPEGGPKDTTPPRVIAENPPSFSRNFKKKDINIYFNEFVQLKEVNEKFIISPPQKKKPKVRLRGKYIMVEFEDSLRSETTYNLDFANSIVDNNEGNPLGDYRYVFSTGNVIDTLELSGNVVDAESNDPVIGGFVLLYDHGTDSVVLTELPSYVARTDSSGVFRLTNLKGGSYRVLALVDDNRDYKYTPEAEWFGFIDSLVTPVVVPMTRTDTLNGDSVVTSSYLAYGPNNLYLRLFKEDLTQLYLTDESRKQRELLNFIFSIPGENDFQIESLDSLDNTDWYVKEQSAGLDTISLWIKDSVMYKRDTLRFKLTYLRSDSLNRRVEHIDTMKFVFTDKKPSGKSNKKERVQAAAVDFLKINTLTGSEQELNRNFVMEFDKPVTEDQMKYFQLTEKIDSTERPVPYQIFRDSIKIRRYHMVVDWNPEAEYTLLLDSAVIRDIYGRHNDALKKTFKVKGKEAYGRILLQMEGVKSQVIVQLIGADTKKAESGRKIFNVVRQKTIGSDQQIDFDFLPPGKYMIRALVDDNGNGKWDTGHYLKRMQPERIVYMPGEMNVRQNFDIEQEFNLGASYTDSERMD